MWLEAAAVGASCRQVSPVETRKGGCRLSLMTDDVVVVVVAAVVAAAAATAAAIAGLTWRVRTSGGTVNLYLGGLGRVRGGMSSASFNAKTDQCQATGRLDA